MRRLLRLLVTLALIALLGLIAASVFGPREQVTLPPPPPLTGQIDRIIVDKSDRRMQLVQDGKVVRTYRVALGFMPEGDKVRQGDGKTPEGEFLIDRRNDRSAFHLSVGIDYPQADDVRRATEGGYSPGGDIFIHGQPNAIGDGFRLRGDWTNGCIAVTNKEMREIWAVTPIGTPVEIRP
jgi:murein L,D-transpeptidase YafK